jgi:hypothetical protein
MNLSTALDQDVEIVIRRKPRSRKERVVSPTVRVAEMRSAHNTFLWHRNRTIARLRIHGTTRRQVWTHFVEVEQRALQRLVVEAFPFFTIGDRTCIPMAMSKSPARSIPFRSPCSVTDSACAGTRAWSASSVLTGWVAVHARVAAGLFAPRPGEAEPSTRQQAYVDRLVGQCARVGPALQQWATAALSTRGVRAIRLIQGVLSLTRRHPRERVLAAVAEAHAHQHFRYQTIRRLIDRMPTQPAPTLATDDPAIRPMTQYTLENFLRSSAADDPPAPSPAVGHGGGLTRARRPSPRPRRARISNFWSCSSRMSSRGGPTGSSRAGSRRRASRRSS